MLGCCCCAGIVFPGPGTCYDTVRCHLSNISLIWNRLRRLYTRIRADTRKNAGNLRRFIHIHLLNAAVSEQWTCKRHSLLKVISGFMIGEFEIFVWEYSFLFLLITPNGTYYFINETSVNGMQGKTFPLIGFIRFTYVYEYTHARIIRHIVFHEKEFYCRRRSSTSISQHCLRNSSETCSPAPLPPPPRFFEYQSLLYSFVISRIGFRLFRSAIFAWLRKTN